MIEETPSDRALAGRVLASGDPVAFRELYRRHTHALYATAVRLTASESDAEDVVHDSWIRAVEHLGGFLWRSSFRTWLTGIVVNRARELARRDRSEVALDEATLPTGRAADLPHDVEAIDLERALAAMPSGYRRVLVLHDIEGFTHEDIAGILGVEAGTSKSQLSRARQWLRRALDVDSQE